MTAELRLRSCEPHCPRTERRTYHHLVPRTDRVGDARRIVVYGATGSGRSTLARRLSELTGIPWTSVDDICWRPGWVLMPLDEQLAYFDALTQTGSWADASHRPRVGRPATH